MLTKEYQWLSVSLVSDYGWALGMLSMHRGYQIDDLVHDVYAHCVGRGWAMVGVYRAQQVNQAVVDVMRRQFGRLRHGQLSRRWQAERQARGPSLDDVTAHWMMLPCVEMMVEQLDWSDRVQEAMAQLSLRQWWMVVEYFWFGQTYAQIGARWRLTESAISISMQKALGVLRHHLPPKEDFFPCH